MTSFFFFVFFWIFLFENNSKYHNFNKFRKQKEGATIIVLWEIWPKKEDTYPKRVIDTHRLEKITDRVQKSATDYIFTNMNINDKDY